MYITSRASTIRNFSLAAVNGTITLIILLIAPLGLAAVISNTFLVTVATFFASTIADQIVRYLQPSRAPEIQTPLESTPVSSQISPRRADSQNLDR
ncbi:MULTISPECIES: CRISPR-associated protein Csx18 [unclassified Microcoleus]|uniref:CRISPR-associated protein Csx18 n=1 Tax=unclassified Microcoleus TaxID=2642155 RepID=UPI002FD49C20